MHGICLSCGGITSTPKTARCKNCYKKQLLELNLSRDQIIRETVVSGKKTAAQLARQFGISREAVRLILVKSGVNYQEIRFPYRQKEKPPDLKKCLSCGKSFVANQNGARVKYCSLVCYKERHNKLQRERVRAYYQTPRGKEVQKRYLENNREKIRTYFKVWSKKKLLGSTP